MELKFEENGQCVGCECLYTGNFIFAESSELVPFNSSSKEMEELKITASMKHDF